jgi:rare lipoprotein A
VTFYQRILPIALIGFALAACSNDNARTIPIGDRAQLYDNPAQIPQNQSSEPLSRQAAQGLAAYHPLQTVPAQSAAAPQAKPDDKPAEPPVSAPVAAGAETVKPVQTVPPPEVKTAVPSVADAQPVAAADGAAKPAASVSPPLEAKAAAEPQVRASEPVETANFTETGKATWYRRTAKNNLVTASGEPLNNKGFTAAHPSLPFGTVVRVTEKSSGKFVDVRINDRGPFGGRFIIDLSEAAAKKINLHVKGFTDVHVKVIKAKG